MEIEIEEQNEHYINATIYYSPLKTEPAWKTIEWFRRYGLEDGKEFIAKIVSTIILKTYISKK